MTESLQDVATVAVPTSRSAPWRRLIRTREVAFVVALLLVILIACLAVPRFATPVTTGYLLLNALPSLLIALPMTLIIITGEIDLSVASIVGLTTAVIGALTLAGWPFPAAFAAAIVAGVLAGIVNGILVAFVGLPSLAVTIGTLALFRGLALVIIGDNSVSATQHPEFATTAVAAKIGGTGFPWIYIGVVVAIAAF